MTFADKALNHIRPESIHRDVSLPRRQRYYSSPADWRDEVVYFLLVDRFSDGQEDTRPLLNRHNLSAARLQSPSDEPWRWDRWAKSDAERWQGGTLKNIGWKGLCRDTRYPALGARNIDQPSGRGRRSNFVMTPLFLRAEGMNLHLHKPKVLSG